MKKYCRIYLIILFSVCILSIACGRLDLLGPALIGFLKSENVAESDTSSVTEPTDELGLMNPLIERTGIDTEPYFSIMEDKIVFVSAYSGSKDIWTAASNGSNLTRLTASSRDETSPVWSSAGDKIAFTSDSLGNQDVWIMDAAGAGLTPVTTDSSNDAMPSFNPGGTVIAFTSDRTGNLEIWTTPVSGGEATQITDNSAADYRPRWSPDGTRIAFVSDRNGMKQIWVVTLATQEEELLTPVAAEHDMPVWSPSGKFIAYALKQANNWDIWIAEFGRSIPPIRATLHTASDTNPTWLANDTGIICTSNRRDDIDIWIMIFFEPLKTP